MFWAFFAIAVYKLFDHFRSKIKVHPAIPSAVIYLLVIWYKHHEFNTDMALAC
jgi:hypothetical protein